MDRGGDIQRGGGRWDAKARNSKLEILNNIKIQITEFSKLTLATESTEGTEDAEKKGDLWH